MVNEAFKEALRGTIDLTKIKIAELEDLVELGKLTNNRDPVAEAKLAQALEQVKLWEIALNQ